MSNAAPDAAPANDSRQHPRTHLFVIATLYTDAGSAPVHVRDMSLCGARIEASALPESGADVILRRGRLQAAGRIVWKLDRRAGVALSSTVDVADWMLRQSGPQDRVDEIVSNFRNSDRPREMANAGAGEQRGAASGRAELEMLRADLERLGSSLIGDAILVATHPEIQIIDISLQRIERLMARL